MVWILLCYRTICILSFYYIHFLKRTYVLNWILYNSFVVSQKYFSSRIVQIGFAQGETVESFLLLFLCL